MVARALTPHAPEDLLRMALSHPEQALELAAQLRDSGTDRAARSFAGQAIGIVLRDRGQPAAAVGELRRALVLARPDDQRVADVRATLGATLVMDGRTRAGLAQLDLAAAAAQGDLLAKVLLRRAHVLALLGRHREALADMRRALVGIRRAGDPVWEARALNNRGLMQLAIGAVDRAERDVVAAEEMFRAAGQELESVHARHNRGVVAHLRGDLPTAIACYEQAAAGYVNLGVRSPDLAIDQCLAYLAAALTAEAMDTIRAALDNQHVQASKRAELELMLAAASLAHGDPAAAQSAAGRARRRFTSQHRQRWADRADFVALQASYGAGRVERRMLAQAEPVARRLVAARAEEAPAALLLAGRLAAELGVETASGLLEEASRYRRRGSALVRATGWLAQALRCQQVGSSRGLYAACAGGLAALDEHRMTLGSSELRALSTSHGDELASLALRQAAAHGTARQLLRWSERWRATSLARPSVRPPADPRWASELAALRDATRRLEESRSGNAPTGGLQRELAQLEAGIRRHGFQLAGSPDLPARFDVEMLLAELGSGCLVELVPVDATLHAVVVRRGQVRRFAVGPLASALRGVQTARFALRQAARGRGGHVGGLGRRLEEALLGPAVRATGDGPLVVSPPGRLHAAPWSLLPSLADRPVTSVPSAGLWLRARAARQPPAAAATVLVCGPGLPSAGAEVAALAAGDPTAIVLRDGAATVERCLRELDGSALAHIAAHGHFRPDSPMFSCVQLDDGPLTVHDFERLAAAPHRVVLSACESGVMAAVGADELLGLAAALLAMGTAGVVSGLTQVNDAATVQVMLDLHARLQVADSVGEALAGARRAARGDVVQAATAACFVAFGV